MIFFKNKISIITYSIITQVLLSNNLAIGTEWIYQNPYPTNHKLLDICFVNEDLGWIVGRKGAILHSEDKGNNWKNQFSSIETDLRGVHFVDSNLGWVVGSNGIILHTNNGGESWKKQSSGTTQNLNDVYFLDNKSGFVIGENSLLLYTFDGGISWDDTIFAGMRPLALNSIYFSDRTTGFIVGESGCIIETRDGGLSWSKKEIDTSLPFYDVFFVDSLHGWAVGGWWPDMWAQGIMINTTDGGHTWNILRNAMGSRVYHSVFFHDENNGWIVGSGYSIYTTSDGGKTLQTHSKEIAFGEGYEWSSVIFNSDSTGFILGNDGLIFKSVDYGNNWFNSNTLTTDNLDDVYFINSDIGWVVGYDGNVLYTENSGINWETIEIGTTERLVEVQFIDEFTGWILSYNLTLFKTIDGGKSWSESKIDNIATSTRSLHFIDELHGWIVGGGRNSIIYYSKDGGANWTVQDNGSFRDLDTVFFMDKNNGWAGGYETIIHTNDGGKNWSQQIDIGLTYKINSIQFLYPLSDRDVGHNNTDGDDLN